MTQDSWLCLKSCDFRLVNYFRPRNTLLYRNYNNSLSAQFSVWLLHSVEQEPMERQPNPGEQQRSLYLPLCLYMKGPDLCGFPHLREGNILLILSNDTHQLDIWVITFLSLWVFFFGFCQPSIKGGKSGQEWLFFLQLQVCMCGFKRYCFTLMSVTLKYHIKWIDFCICTS